MNASYDIVVVGGGLVGMVLCHALCDHGLRVALVDAKPLPAESTSQDSRAIALSNSSQHILDTLGLWEKLKDQATPIETVHVSKRGVFAKTHLRAVEVGHSALGYVVPAQTLAVQVARDVEHLPDLTLYTPATVESLQIKSSHAQLIVLQGAQSSTITARLVVAADGSQSSIAKQLDIHQEKHDYQQTAIVSTLTTNLSHKNEAYERFSSEGVIALLPLKEKKYGVVWATSQEYAKELLSLSTDAYLSELKKQMGYYWGKELKLSERTSYPLVAMKTTEQIRPRVVILGNAAHTLHPVAAQGLNLALRSVAWLAETIVSASKQDIGELSVLKKYTDLVRKDHSQVQKTTHGLVELIDTISHPALWNMGLGLFDKIPFIKKQFMRKAMGLSGTQAKLVRGVALSHD